jgi:Zn-dependent protease with chaperone function
VRFLERQEAARRRTQTLRVQFGLIAVLATVLSLAFALAAGLLLTKVEYAFLKIVTNTGGRLPELTLWMGAVAHLAVLLPLIVYLVFRASLDDMLLKTRNTLEARTLADPKDDPAFSRLRNVVEEMSLAAGIPSPRVCLWPEYRAINSVTLGYAPTDATVYVTRLAVDGLSRPELQALVAYSMSQILNGDMALNMRLAVFVRALKVAPECSLWLMKLPPVTRGQIGGLRAFFWFNVRLPAGIALSVVTSPLYIAGSFLQSRVGRERQRLGDASVIQFTRDPQPLIDLLFKALAHTASGRLHSVAALSGDFAHCCFVSPGTAKWLSPQDPIATRLHALDPKLVVPAFHDEQLDAARLQVRTRANAAEEQRRAADRAAWLAAPGLAERVRAAAEKSQRPKRRKLELDSDTATLIALLFDRNEKVRSRQLDALRARLDEASPDLLFRAYGQVGELLPMDRSRALQQSLPRLRTLPLDDLLVLRECVVAIELADDAVDAFEYALARSVTVFIDGLTHPRLPHGPHGFDELEPDVATLLSVVANFTAHERAPRAFAAGARHLGLKSGASYQPPRSWTTRLDGALTRLARLTPMAKQVLLEALEKTAAYDAFENWAERELIRVIGVSLHCAVPRAPVG